jgi:hypothetical protein
MRKLSLIALLIIVSFISCEKEDVKQYNIPDRVLQTLNTKGELKTEYPKEPLCTGIDSNGVSYVVYEWDGAFYSGQWTTNYNYSEQFISSNVTVATDLCSSKSNNAWLVYKN